MKLGRRNRIMKHIGVNIILLRGLEKAANVPSEKSTPVNPCVLSEKILTVSLGIG